MYYSPTIRNSHIFKINNQFYTYIPYNTGFTMEIIQYAGNIPVNSEWISYVFDHNTLAFFLTI